MSNYKLYAFSCHLAFFSSNVFFWKRHQFWSLKYRKFRRNGYIRNRSSNIDDFKFSYESWFAHEVLHYLHNSSSYRNPMKDSILETTVSYVWFAPQAILERNLHRLQGAYWRNGVYRKEAVRIRKWYTELSISNHRTNQVFGFYCDLK